MDPYDRSSASGQDANSGRDAGARPAQYPVSPWSEDPGSAYPEVLLAPEVLSASPPELTRRRRLRTPLVLAVVTVLTLVAAGAAYAGFRLWYGSGPQPEEATPASVTAFARVDFDPGIATGRKLEGLLKKYPGDANGTEARLDSIEKSLLRDLGLGDLSFAADIKPWFGNRVGAAAWRDSDNQQVALIVLASKDDSKARTALGSVQSRRGSDKFGYVLANGYALVARSERHAQADAAAAAGEARQHSLAGLKDFSDALATLPADQTLVGWLDLANAGSLLGRGASGFTDLLQFGARPSKDDPLGIGKLTGHVILGAQAVDNGIEVRTRLTGALAGAPSAPHAGSDVRPALGALPGNSIVAVAISQDSSSALNRTLGKQLGAGVGGLLGDFLDPATFEGADSNVKPDPRLVARMQEMSRKISDGVAALLSARMISVAVTSLGGDVPGLIVTAETDGDAAARAVVDGATVFGGLGLTATAQGSRVEVKTRTYAATGKLADDALYREAITGAPNTPFEAFFVDVNRWIATDKGMSAQERRNIEPLKAVGGGFGLDGQEMVGLIRLVIR